MRRRLLCALPAGLALAALYPRVGGAARGGSPSPVGYVPPGEGATGVVPAARLSRGEPALASTGIQLGLDGHVAPQACDRFDLDLTLYHQVRLATGATVGCLVWQFTHHAVPNLSAPQRFFVPLAGGRLELSLHGRVRGCGWREPVTWQQPVRLSPDPGDGLLNLRRGTYFIPLLDRFDGHRPDWSGYRCERGGPSGCAVLTPTQAAIDAPGLSFLQLAIRGPEG